MTGSVRRLFRAGVRLQDVRFQAPEELHAAEVSPDMAMRAAGALAPELFGIRADKGGFTISNRDEIFLDLIRQVGQDDETKRGRVPKAVVIATHGSTPFSHNAIAF